MNLVPSNIALFMTLIITDLSLFFIESKNVTVGPMPVVIAEVQEPGLKEYVVMLTFLIVFHYFHQTTQLCYYCM